MNRASKQGSGKKPEKPITELLENLVEDIMGAADLSHSDWLALWTSPFVPMAIPTQDGRQYPCTQAGVNAAHAITDQAWKSNERYQATLARAKFDRASFEALGSAMANFDAFVPSDAEPTALLDNRFYTAFATDYESKLSAGAGSVTEDLDRHIPCSLFRVDHGVTTFDVGPVTFRPRDDWIAAFVEEPALGHVLSCETGSMTRDDLREHVRDGTSDIGHSEAVAFLDFLGSHGWVATVRINGHEANKSHEKAMVIVGLAIDAIGLRFPLEAARSFTKSGRQHLFNEVRFASRPSGVFLKGWFGARSGIGDKPGALGQKMAAERNFLDAAGVLLTHYLGGRGAGKAVHLVERWANALYWFGDARREISDFMAVVDYGCAADGISGAGGNVNDMMAFAEAALDFPAGRKSAGAMSTRDAVRTVYADGRNKLAHGEASGLFDDHSETRAIGDMLVTALLNEITPILAQAVKSDDNMIKVSEAHAYKALQTKLRGRI